MKVDLRGLRSGTTAGERWLIWRLLLLPLLLLAAGCQAVQPEAVADPTLPPAVPVTRPAAAPAAGIPPSAEMPPEEALLLALECEGNLVSNTIEYTFREGMQAGFDSPEAAFAGYTPLSELPLGEPAFRAVDDTLVVRVYGEDGRYTGKAAARLGPDGSWVVTSIVRCLGPAPG